MHHKKLIFFLANFSRGGAGEAIKKLSIDLRMNGFQCKIICLGSCAYKKELTKNSIEVKELDFISVFNAMPEIKKIVKSEVKLKKIIFISNINYVNALSLLFLRSLDKLKIVLFERTPYEELNFYFNSFSRYVKNKIIKFLIKLLYKKADLVISNNKTTSKKLRSELKINIYTIYSQSIKKIKKFHIKKFTKKLKIIWIGRFTDEKSFLTLVRAINKIQKINLQINVLGDGKDKNKYLNIIEDLGLKKNFFFRGYVNNVDEYLSKSDLFINTSVYEGFPNSVVQAINCSVPVIASKSCGGINEILKNGKFGTFYNVGNEIDLANKIMDFHRNNKKHINKARLAHSSLKKYDFGNLHNKFYKILKKI